MIDMWLSTAETSILDNALVTMEHLYRTGRVHIHLQRLINEQSAYDINYFIEKTSCVRNRNEHADNDDCIENEDASGKSQEKLTFKLSMSDVEDHKRQLTFCNVDLLASANYKTMILEEQLKLLGIIDKIFNAYVKLEMAGHPNFQMLEKQIEIYDSFGK